MKTVRVLEQTCFGCPSTWDVDIEDYGKGYVRYRWGTLALFTDENGLIARTHIEGHDSSSGICSIEEVHDALSEEGFMVFY